MSRRLDPGPLGTGPLTKLDERVLAAIARPQHAATVVAMLNRHERRHYMPLTSESDVRAVLRGFEHLGRAERRGGWWRARSAGCARDDA